jgi:hypothetical protein
MQEPRGEKARHNAANISRAIAALENQLFLRNDAL